MNRIATLLVAGAIVATTVASVIGHAQSRVYIAPKDSKSQLGYRDIADLNWRDVAKHYAPANSIDDWRKVHPARHWKEGRSAYQIAHAWQNANPNLPPEVAALFYGPVELLAAIPEHKTPLLGGRTPSQSDILAFIRIKNSDRVCAVTVEGKMGEGFDQTVGEWSNNASANRIERLKHITAKLGLAYPPADEIRYQLLHRTAAAVIEAERFNADCAATIVHSFSPTHESFDDFAKFLNAFGIRSATHDKIYKTTKPGIDLYFGWASSAGTVATVETPAPQPKPAPAKPKPQPAQVAEVAAPSQAVSTPAKSQPGFLDGNFVWMLVVLAVLAGIFLPRMLKRKSVAPAVKTAQPAESALAQTTEVDNLAATVKEMSDKLNRVLVAMDSAAKIREIESRIRELESKKDASFEDESYRKGLEFEKFVVRLFGQDTEHFTLLDWSGDKSAGDGIRPKNAGDPDLKYEFSNKGEKSAIAVECKWRSGFRFGFADDYQVRNYQEFENREGLKTFIALGVGGKQANPKRVFVIPVSEISGGMLPESELARHYEQENEKSRFWYHRKAGRLKLH